MKKILTIIGPTAVGKTDLTVRIAENLNGEIIGLDSRQIYKYMNIGTAQPTNDDMKSINHHLIGCKEPWEPISAGKYAKMIIEKISEIQEREKVPIICGGAGLYFRAITKGIFSESYTDAGLRKELEYKYKEDSMSLMLRLQSIDPEYAKIVHINNKKRLIRALEIFELTGFPPTKHFKNQKMNQSQLLDLYTVYLSLEKNVHINKINERANHMVKMGWVDEVDYLLSLQKEKRLKMPALDSIGYKQVIEYINDDIDKETLIKTVVNKTRQYARSQDKWFKKEKIDLFVDLTNLEGFDVHKYICDIYNII